MFLRDLGPAVREFAAPSTKGAGQSYFIKGKPIFRSGGFADSEGFEHEWEALHITQMYDHFSLLSGRGVFEDVPVRKGHPDRGGLFGGESRNRMDELVGYITGVTAEERKNPADGNTYTYLLADLEIIHEDAQKHVKSGLWRNMSAEIGPYVTNNNAEYWPCIMGVAYVDIPAVEGLKGHSKANHSFSLILEEGMTTTTVTPGQVQPPLPGTSAEHAAPQGQAPAPQFLFTIGEQTSSDFAAVQNFINGIVSENTELREFRRVAEESGRDNFVDALVRDNKINAGQTDAYKAYAKGLGTAEFNNWKTLMDASAPMAITGAQGAGFSGDHQQSSETDAKAARIADLKGMVSTHSLNQVPVDKIKGMASYKELVTLDPTFSL